MKFFNYFVLIIFTIIMIKNVSYADNSHSKITKNLRCLICQGQSVYDSDSEFANSLKLLVKKKLDEGMNEKQIYEFLKNKYRELDFI